MSCKYSVTRWYNYKTNEFFWNWVGNTFFCMKNVFSGKIKVKKRFEKAELKEVVPIKK